MGILNVTPDSFSDGGRYTDVDIAVHHLLAPERASQIEAAVAERLGDKVRLTYSSEIGAVVAAHVGPGLVSIVLHRR